MREQLSTRLEHELDSRSVGLAAWLYRRTRGRIARLYQRDVLLLTTTGRRSGLRRTVPLQFFADGDDMVVVAANSGMATHPAWYLNLKSEPEALVELDGQSVPVHAEEMSEAETESFWTVVLRRAPDYSRYPERTDRRIPMVRLTPDASPRPAESHSTATPLVRTTVGALGLVGVTALAGGIEMIAAPQGNAFVEGAWLEEIPVLGSYRLPGLALAGLGAAALTTANGLARLPESEALSCLERRTGRHWSWGATTGVGLALLAWIGAEVVFVPRRSAIEGLYAAVALGLIAACGHPDVRNHTRLPARTRVGGGAVCPG